MFHAYSTVFLELSFWKLKTKWRLTMTTRGEHIDWCKQRALEVLETGDAKEAYAAMCQGLAEHSETADHPAVELGMMRLMAGELDSKDAMKKFIEDFG